MKTLVSDKENSLYTVPNLEKGFASLHEHNLLEIVLPHLRELRDIVKETVCFGVLGSEKGVFIEQAQGCVLPTPKPKCDLPTDFSSSKTEQL